MPGRWIAICHVGDGVDLSGIHIGKLDLISTI